MHAQGLDEAKKLYNEGKYDEAKPIFERLWKKAPSNTNYNHWYGVCCLETGDLQGAEKPLKFAVRRRVQEAYRYLGLLYFQTYRFEEAEEMLNDYIELLEKKKKDTAPFEELLDMAQNANRMLDKVEDVQIIDSVVVDKADFLNAYTLSEESGKLMTYQDFFQTSEPNLTSVYMNQKGDKIYYAHETESNHACLFTQSKLLDHWGDEKQLPMNINSDDDDGYPFVLPDGVTIYYASKGNGSLGGYDLFVTRYNIESDTYLSPEQLGMPYNSPFNDYMMVLDETKRLGWFVSDRFQPEGKVCVYLFIPNEDRKRIESEDIELKRARASITSIKDSWVAGSDYGDLVKLAHTAIPYGQKKIRKDFTFPIDDRRVYYTLDDIQSPEARNLYQKAISLNQQIQALSARIDEMRSAYTKGNPTKRDQLRPSILEAEEQLESLLPQPEEWEKRARNAEVTYLRNHAK